MKFIDTEIQIPVHYISIGILSREWNFPYSDRFFLNDSGIYSHRLAQASLGFAVSADRDQSFSLKEQNSGVRLFFENAGFDTPKYCLYDTEPTKDTVACAIACKKIKDFTLVAVTVCGNGYAAEWKGNFTVGTGERHSGFSIGAELVKKNIREYLKESSITGKIKLWCGAYSRGAAVLNLAGYDLLKDKTVDEVFGYLFASPSVVQNPEQIRGMFNIVRKDDPFAMLPNPSWHYGRYGTLLYIPSADGREVSEKADEIAYKLGCGNCRTNPVSANDFRKVYSCLDILFPTPESFCSVVPVIYSIYDSPTRKNLLKNYKHHRALKKTFSSEQRKTYRILRKFLLKRVIFFGRYTKRQIKAGFWDKDSRPDTNLFKEHSSDMYVIGMFASDIFCVAP